MKSRLNRFNSNLNVKSANNRKKKSGKEEDFSISIQAKKQILGFILFLIGLFLFITLITYSSSDIGKIDDKKFFELIGLIFKTEQFSLGISNLLGIVGALTSHFFIVNLFGYFSVLISVMLFVLGYALLMKKELNRYITFNIYLTFLILNLCTFAGLFEKFWSSSVIPVQFTGAVGDFLANVFYQLTGSVGAFAILLFTLVIILFLIFDSSILKTFARLKLFVDRIKDKFKKEKKELEEKRQKKFEEKSLETDKKINLKEQDSARDTKKLYEDALKKEKERILRTKYGKSGDLISESAIIKETEINRPGQTELPEDVYSDAESQESQKEGMSSPVKEQVEKDSQRSRQSIPAHVKTKTKEIKLSESREKSDYEKEIYSSVSGGKTDADEDSEQELSEEDYFAEEKIENYIPPALDLLNEPTKEEFESIPDEELTENGRLLQEKLLMFGIKIEKVFATPGPVVTLYELIPAPDVKLSKIESLQDDIALAMKARGIRMIIPIPGKGTVGVEIPNSKFQIVKVKSVLSAPKFIDSKKRLTVAFGKKIDGEIYLDDLSKMPHVLIAGATGSGKSVGINTIIASLLFKLHPSDLKFILIDPKKIELSLYSKLRKHFIATTTDVNESIITTPQNAVSILKSVELEMEQRYDRLANAGVRYIEDYNKRYEEGTLKNTEDVKHRRMPYIVVIIDELADLMITAKKDIEDPIARIAQMARAVGIHLIVATQRPSVDVITGVIKANFPVRIAYQVASKIDSRTILDMSGAEQLLRNGDMLYMSASTQKPIRIQNAYITTEECEKIVEYVSKQPGFKKPYLLPPLIEKHGYGGAAGERDEMFEEAARLILKLQQCSTSTLQRRLKLGYARAARIVDQMEHAGIVGPSQGAKGREILITEDELENIL